ncbi:MAG TPA: peroxiredoxin [Polyangiaceae bacterium]|jgi:peroxiredoxin (alkyl hydroperoxide reductase subunit C)
MTIQLGQRIPSVTIKQATPGGGTEVDPSALFSGKRVVMFSLPGAFTPTCSSQHLPGYLARYDDLRAKGIDLIACLSVNDAWVMQAWADAHQVGDKIVMLADGSAVFTKALGIENDRTTSHMGIRARRGAFTIRDNVVESVELEEPGKFEVSSADACFLRLG